jgi:Zn-dependent peptidase ImmA (M78 family)
MPKDAAESILNEIWGDRGFPVDPVVIAQEIGVKVIETELPPDVSGVLAKEEGQDAVIFLSSSDHKNRKRFTCAHELGHFIKKMELGEQEISSVNFRDSRSSEGKDPEEMFANQFAANLLMPEEEVLRQKRTPSFVLARYFGVSPEAIINRLKSLGLQ